jgi:hypothetical protein
MKSTASAPPLCANYNQPQSTKIRFAMRFKKRFRRDFGTIHNAINSKPAPRFPRKHDERRKAA